MSQTLKASQLCAILCSLAAAAAVQAQVFVKPPGIVPIPVAKYYSARDLGRITENKPVGCLARNGALAVSRYRYESTSNRWLSRAVIPGGNADFAFFYVEGYDSWVSGCNSHGEYVGVSRGHGGGVIWDIDWTAPQRLGSNVLGPNEPAAINDARQVVGNTANSWPAIAGARWDTSQVPNDPTMTKHTLAPGGATAINTYGVVTMTQWLPGQPSRAVLYAANLSTFTYLPLPGATASWANGIDDQARVVGTTEDAGSLRRGYVWHASEGFVQLQPARLGLLAPGQHAEANAIGLNRTVVGQSYNMVGGQPTQYAATVWIQAGTARNLNREAQMNDGSALPTLTDAVAVSDAGAILCEARTASGERRAVLLTPIPGGRWSLYP